MVVAGQTHYFVILHKWPTLETKDGMSKIVIKRIFLICALNECSLTALTAAAFVKHIKTNYGKGENYDKYAKERLSFVSHLIWQCAWKNGSWIFDKPIIGEYCHYLNFEAKQW